MKTITQARIPEDAVGIWFIGEAGFVLKTSEGTVIFVDPYLTNSVVKTLPDFPRLYPPPILPEDVACDILLCTHDHQDHLDDETIKALKNKERMTFVGPAGCCKHYDQLHLPRENMLDVNVGQAIECKDVKIFATFTVPSDEKTIDGIGAIITLSNGISIYHSGDTAYVGFLDYIRAQHVDIALLCINGKYGNMSYEDAALMASRIGAKVVIPHHYDMFALNGEDPSKFCSEVRRKDPNIECHVLPVMEMLVIRASNDGREGSE